MTEGVEGERLEERKEQRRSFEVVQIAAIKS